MKKIALILTIVALALLFLVIAPMVNAASVPEYCQKITFKSLDGNTYTLADFKGKTSLLIFWRSTCPHCRNELPNIKELYTELGDEINFIAVSLDTNEEYFKNYLKELKPNFPIYRTLELRPCINEVDRIRGVPTLFILDKDLNIIKKFEGTTPNEKIKEVLEQMKSSS